MPKRTFFGKPHDEAPVDPKPTPPERGGNVMSTKTLVPVVVPPAQIEFVEERPAPNAVSSLDSHEPVVSFAKVNLRHAVRINGIDYGPGVGVLVPADSLDVWKHALA